MTRSGGSQVRVKVGVPQGTVLVHLGNHRFS